MSFSPALTLYRAAAAVLGGLAGFWLEARAAKGKEDPARLGERLGKYAKPRPPGQLVWLHAASVGETGVALQICEALSARDASFLLTTGTTTSAQIAARRGGERLTHVYAPLDRPDAVARFIAHWRPDLGVFVESELWPNLILAAKRNGVPLALVNARMSPASLARWRSWAKAGARLWKAFAFVHCADQRTAQVASALRGAPAPLLANLKLAAPAPPVDPGARAELAAAIGARPLWLAASTHEGEDEIALAAHRLLRARWPDALLILAPRHPERGAAIAARAEAAPRRSRSDPISAAPVYVADSLGEMGLLYDLAPVALVAGSLLPGLTGHNPIEPAKLGAAILAGPYVESFEAVYDTLAQAGGATNVCNAQEIAAAVARLWEDRSAHARQTEAARSAVAGGDAALKQTLAALCALLENAPDAPA
jgi:3-deoxy-D-manno-octulosonic-acid transferase